MLGKCLERGKVKCHFAGILGVLEMPGAPQPPKWAANHQTTRPETGKKCQKPMKTKHAPLIPTMASRIFLDGNAGNMEGIEGRTQGWENF